MDVFQAAKAADCTDLAEKLGLKGRRTERGRGKWVCPFHDDHDPSMVTYPQERSPSHYHCFSCGAHGDATELRRQVTGESRLSAAKSLCKELGVDVNDLEDATSHARLAPEQEDPAVVEVVLAVCEVWRQYLVEWAESEVLAACTRLQGQPHDSIFYQQEVMFGRHYSAMLERYQNMTAWEVLHELRKEFDALGVGDYRRLRVAGTVS